MDELRDYLNSLFKGVTETPDVLRAKADLLQMMEDKYEGLISEGVDAETAKQTVIDEFGTFDEVAKELGIDDIVHENAAGLAKYSSMAGGSGGSAADDGHGAGGTAGDTSTQNSANSEGEGYGTSGTGNAGPAYDRRKVRGYRNFYSWTASQVKDYISFAKKHAHYVAGGVACCILAPYLASVFDDLFDYFGLRRAASALSGLAFFACVAAGVAMFIMASRMTSRSGNIKRDAVSLDAGAEEELRSQTARVDGSRTGYLVVGIILCILGPAASGLGDVLPGVLGIILDPGVLLFSAIGVYCIICSVSIGNRLKELSKATYRYVQNQADISEGQRGDNMGGVGSSMGAAGNGANSASTWQYHPKSDFPIVVIVIIVLVLGMSVNLGINLIRGVGVFARSPLSFIGVSNMSDYSGEESYSINDVDSIDFDLAMGNVEILIGDSDQIKCTYGGRFPGRPTVKLNKNDRCIEIKTSGGFQLFGLGASLDGRVMVTVPRGSKLSYSLDLSAGDVRIVDVAAEKISGDLSAGNMELAGVTADWIDMDQSAGNFKAQNCVINADMALDLSAGNASLQAVDVGNFECNMSAGNFSFVFDDKAKADMYDYDLDTSFGDIKVMSSDYGNHAIIDAAGTSKLGVIKVSASAGDITIK